jgi:hypothetical protein
MNVDRLRRRVDDLRMQKAEELRQLSNPPSTRVFIPDNGRGGGPETVRRGSVELVVYAAEKAE